MTPEVSNAPFAFRVVSVTRGVTTTEAAVAEVAPA